MEEVEVASPEGRRFDKSFLRTWPAALKITEMVLCALCFLCNELAWIPLVAYPARTFLSVMAVLSLIASALFMLVVGCHIDQHYSNTTWWRVLVIAAPGASAFFLMIGSAAQLGKGGYVDAGFQAAAVFGFLAFSTYLVDAIFQFVSLHKAGELPELCVPPVVANNLSKMTGKGSGRGGRAAGDAPSYDADPEDVPPSWNVARSEGRDRRSAGSDDSKSARGSYSLNS